MMGTGDFSLKDEQGNSCVPEQIKEVVHANNNYARPGGQVKACGVVEQAGESEEVSVCCMYYLH